ncbi:MAG: hypothetical protein NVS2B17_29160 [Candidatus Velthaea sp.]
MSSLRQETAGQSLQNQERAFTDWLARHGHERVAAYRESASAKSIEGRREFVRMIAELADTKPDAIVVDTLDRFTRDLRDGLDVLHQLRGHRVGLLPLDWRRERPIDVDDDRDWDDVVHEFSGAERERRRIRRRMLRSFEGRRERGATLCNRGAFGLRKEGDRLVPSDDAWIVREADRMIIAGSSLEVVAKWAATVAARPPWAYISGLRDAMENPNYVRAGVRTPETQTALYEAAKRLSERYGGKRKHEHEFSGIFACAECGAVTTAAYRIGIEQVQCAPKGAIAKPHPAYAYAVEGPDRVRAGWDRWIERIVACAGFEQAWAAADNPTGANERRALERKLADLDQRAAAMKQRRDAAFAMACDVDPMLVAQARRALREIEGDERALEIEQQATLALLMRTVPNRREADEIRTAIEFHRDGADDLTVFERAEFHRRFVRMIGERPTITRERRTRKNGRAAVDDPIVIAWPAVERLIAQASEAVTSAR